MRNMYTKKYNFSSNNSIGLVPWNVDFLEEIELLAQSLCKEFDSLSTMTYARTDTSIKDYNNIEACSSTLDSVSDDTSDKTFNDTLDNDIQTDCASNKQNVILVFPHGRPRRYLEDRYKKMAKKSGRAHILPHIMTGNDFLSLCLSHWERDQTPYEELQALDRISLLHEAVIRVAKSLPESAVLRRLVEVPKIEKSEDAESESMYAHENVDEKSLSMSKFFPWAHSLDALFEECFQQLVDVIDIAHAEGEVSAFAAALLSALRSIHTEYIELLKTMSTDMKSTETANISDANTFADTLNTNSIVDTTHSKFDTSPSVSLFDTSQNNVFQSDAFQYDTSQKDAFSTRVSTPAFSAYRAAQFIEAYSAHMHAQEKGSIFDFGNQRPDTIGVTSWTEEARSVFFDNFMPEIFKDKIIIFSGFVLLTEAENTLYKYFWKNGASIVWHSDPALCDGKDSHENVHYSCADHLEWLKAWNTHCTLLCEPNTQKPRIHFYAAYDAHSQVQALKNDLENCVESLLKNEEDTRSCEKRISSHEFHTNPFNSSIHSKHTSEQEEFFNSIIGINTDNQDEIVTIHSHDENVGDKQEERISIYNSMADDTLAVLLPKPSLLMPVLHELPEKDINISMGYPINRTLLGQFLETIIRLQENKQTSDVSSNRIHYVWKDILSLLRHPYARMLVPYDSALVYDEALEYEQFFNEQDNKNTQYIKNGKEIYIDIETAEKEKNAWRSLLYILEKSLREGNASLHITDFLDDVLGDIDNKNFVVSEDLDRFISEFFEHSVNAWEQVQSLYDVAHALEHFVDFLLKHGGVLWQSFPLDAEALVRCVERVIPALRDNSVTHEYLPPDALFMVLRQLVNEERIPFEADPLSGMQILGMLESRLLRFRKLFIMDMTEDNLPGIIQQDPLMPDSLRNLLALPDTHKREILTAHTFYRLIVGAEDVWLYWQEGIQASEVQSRRSLRSRFVEECLWEEEKKKGQMVKNGEDFLRSADCRPIAPLRQTKKIIPCTTAVKNKLRSFFDKPLSSSALDTYIHCPAKFFYTYLGGLGEIEEVSEGDDYRELGVWLHKLLQDIYHDFIGNCFEHNPDNLERLLELFHARLKSPEVSKFISAESYFMLARAGEFHLKNYWESMPYIIQPMSLENKYECDVPSVLFIENPLGISKIKLQGRFDRVDMRLSHDLVEELADDFTEYKIHGISEIVASESPIKERNKLSDQTNEPPTEHASKPLMGEPEQKTSEPLGQLLKTSEIFKEADKAFAHLISSELNNHDSDPERNFCCENFVAGVEHWILDYKTGKGQKLNKKFWGNTALWDSIKNANQTKTQDKSDAILLEISQLMANIQLPFYLYVYGQNYPQILCNAAWIFLGEEKKEVPLVEIKSPKTAQKGKRITRKASSKDTISLDNNENESLVARGANTLNDKREEDEASSLLSWELLHSIKTKFMPELLEFSLNHLLHAKSFKAVEGKNCTYCPHKDYC